MIVDTRSPVDERILEFLKSHWRAPKTCWVCGQNVWSIDPNVAELRFFSLQGFVVGGPVVPLVVVTCTNCGNIVLFNAMAVGWAAPSAPAQGDPKGGQ